MFTETNTQRPPEEAQRETQHNTVEPGPPTQRVTAATKRTKEPTQCGESDNDRREGEKQEHGQKLAREKRTRQGKPILPTADQTADAVVRADGRQ